MDTNTKTLVDALNADLSDELAAIVQYMWHHVMATGKESPEIAEIFDDTSKDEMKHAELIAERLDYFGAVPTTIPTSIKVGGKLTKMMEEDLAGEEKAIATYKTHIKLAADLGDPVTRLMLENILSDEEGHAHTWRTILEK
jgi:bacterioferritin